MEDNPKLGAVVDRWGEKLRTWCAEWEIGESGEEDEEERVGEKERWEECVEKCEELIWLATVSLLFWMGFHQVWERWRDRKADRFGLLDGRQVIYASSSRPGYVDVKLDFFLYAFVFILFTLILVR